MKVRQARPSRPSTPPVHNSPPARPPPQMPVRQTVADDLERLLEKSSEVTLYSAPSHRGFVALSLISGVTFVVGGVNFFAFALGTGRTDEKGEPIAVPLMVKVSTLIPSAAMILAGTLFLVAPAALVRSITLFAQRAVPGSAGAALPPSARPSVSDLRLRFHLRPGFPYFARRGKVIELAPGEVQLDPRIASHAGEDSARSSSLMVQNVRRLFLRDSFAYMQLGDQGLYKMDVYRAFLLGNGSPLKAMVKMVPGLDRSILGRVRTILAS